MCGVTEGNAAAHSAVRDGMRESGSAQLRSEGGRSAVRLTARTPAKAAGAEASEGRTGVEASKKRIKAQDRE